MKTINYLIIFFIATLSLTSCTRDDDNPPKVVNQSEVITDVTLTFKDNTGASKTYIYTNPLYRDDDYLEPLIQLEEGKTYQVMANFYDKSDPDNPEVQTEEIIEEKDDHFLEYRFTDVNVNLTRTDTAETTDDNGIQIGLHTQWVAEQAGTGKLQITLIHQPETKDTSDSIGNHTGGETDAEVLFDVNI